MGKPELSILLPVFNEEATLEAAVQDIDDVVPDVIEAPDVDEPVEDEPVFDDGPIVDDEPVGENGPSSL